MKLILSMLTTGSVLLAAGCSPVGPDYSRPEFQPSAHYKNTTSSALGVSSSWWRSFRDPLLNQLQSQLLAQNLDLKAALARRQQAFARLGITAADLFPQANGSGIAERNKDSRNNLSGSRMRQYYDQYQIGANLSYEIDLWGRVRRLVEAGKADAQAADYAVADVRVALQTQLARQYFALRFLDAEMATLEGAIKTRQDNVKITDDRFNAGLTSELDTTKAKAELANLRAELMSLRGTRAQLENSIAVLLGKQASQFRISSRNYNGYLPSIPAGVPSGLLYRRPDVAVAERKIAAASARIGVAQAERYPKISLTGSGGSSSIASSKFLDWSSRFYSLGSSVSAPLFQGGRIKSGIRFSEAERAEALANYQKTTLNAIADVESALASLNALRSEARARKQSVDFTTRTYDLSVSRYKEGVTSYLDVADAQRENLNAKRAAVRTRGRQFGATIQLIQALGGGFSKGGK